MPQHPTKSKSRSGSGAGNSTNPPGSSGTIGTGDHAVAGMRLESSPMITRKKPGDMISKSHPSGIDHMP